jgi:ribulose-phosphate 3-epimerase
MEKTIVPAIIAENQKTLDLMLSRLPQETSRVMLDVMDGSFVPSHSLDFDFQVPDKWKYEAHLMISNPIESVIELASKVEIIIFHIESVNNPSELIEVIKSKELESYIAINPETPVDSIKPYVNKLDGILIMTVIPGKYGSKFIEKALEKVKELRSNSNINIEVDGGMNLENATKAVKAGANIIASGSYIMNANNPNEAFKTLKSVFKE